MQSTEAREQAQPGLEYHLWFLRRFIGRAHLSAKGPSDQAVCEDAHESLDFVLRSMDASRQPERTQPRVRPLDASEDISMLELPRALLSRLANATIRTVGELAACSEVDLLRTKGIGSKFVAIIKSELAAAGFQLSR